MSKCIRSTEVWNWVVLLAIIHSWRVQDIKTDECNLYDYGKARELCYTTGEKHKVTGQNGNQICNNAESVYICNWLVMIHVLSFSLNLIVNISIGPTIPNIDNRSYVVDKLYCLTSSKTTCDFVFFPCLDI